MVPISLTSWQQHELLHGQFVASVAAAVDDVEGGYGQDDVFVTGEVSDMTVQRNTLAAETGMNAIGRVAWMSWLKLPSGFHHIGLVNSPKLI